MRVMIGALALAVRAMGRMHVELYRQTLRHEVCFSKAARQLDPVVESRMPEIGTSGLMSTG